MNCMRVTATTCLLVVHLLIPSALLANEPIPGSACEGYVYWAERCGPRFGPYATESEAIAEGVQAIYGGAEHCDPPTVIRRTEWPTLEQPARVWGCGSRNLYPRPSRTYPEVEAINRLHITVRYALAGRNECIMHQDGMGILRIRTNLCRLNGSDESLEALGPMTDGQKTQLRRNLKQHYGPLVDQWEMNEAVLEVYGRFLRKVEDGCRAMNFVPLPLPTPVTSLGEFLLFVLQGLSEIHARESAFREEHAASYACVVAAAVGMKSEFVAAGSE